MQQANQMLVALLDEYRRAAIDLKEILEYLPPSYFLVILDPDTKDEDCRSIKTVVEHVVRSGYGYANYIAKEAQLPNNQPTISINEPKNGITQVDEMLDYTEKVLSQIWHQSDKQINDYRYQTKWGQNFDIEQMLEHAIVHILRHRRQIEGFINA